jgi:hypothetical protein
MLDGVTDISMLVTENAAALVVTKLVEETE